MRCSFYCLLLGVIISLSAVSARIIQIPSDFATIQSGIDAGNDGDTVLVASGTYMGDGNRDIDFQGKQIHLKSVLGRDSTRISCGGLHRGLYFHTGEDSLSIIEGFTITWAFAESIGGGIFCDAASPKIIRCTISGNKSHYGGGIGLINGSNAVIDSCTLLNNYAISDTPPIYGGGVYCTNSSPRITNCRLEHNWSGSQAGYGQAGGGGLYCGNQSSPYVSACTFYRDSALVDGGGIYCANSAPIIEDCSFDHLVTGGGSAAAILFENSSPTVIGCSFTNCIGPSGGGAIHSRGSTCIIDSCFFRQNRSDNNGGAIWAGYGSEMLISNTTFRKHRDQGSLGGTIYLEASSFTITNCLIDSSGVVYRGGGAAFIRSTGSVANSQFKHCASMDGGGVYVEMSDSISFINCTFERDTTDSQAGGLSTQLSSISLDGCTFSNNFAPAGAAIMFDFPSSPIVRNCLFVANSAYAAAGVAVMDSASPIFINCTFYGNDSEYGSSIFNFSYSPITVTNCILSYGVRGNAIESMFDEGIPVLSYCDIYGNQGGDWVGDIAPQWHIRGNSGLMPHFRDRENGDLRLQYNACGFSINSPCVDAGDPLIIDTLLDCSWGMATERSDMGAYGGGESLSDEIEGDGIRPLDQFSLHPSYPNPFNAQTTISYSLPESGPVTLTIYNLLGQKVATLFDGIQTAGEHKVVWDAQKQPSGVYFAKLVAEQHKSTFQMVLLK